MGARTLWLVSSINGMFWLAKTQRKQHICQVDEHALAYFLAVKRNVELSAVREEEPRTIPESTRVTVGGDHTYSPSVT